MANDFKDIHNLLVDEIKKLSDTKKVNDIDTLKMESERARSMCVLTSQVLQIAQVQLQALKVREEYNLMFDDLPRQLDVGNNEITSK